MALPLPTYFTQFLTDIRPTDAQREGMANGHRVLRERLAADEKLAPDIVTTFLQGSYRRATAIRPRNEKRSDVDIIVVTRMKEEEFTPQRAMNVFKPFLERHYKGKYVQQGRSFGIELTAVALDLVITSAPSEAQEGAFKRLARVNTDDLKLLAERVKEDAEWKNEPLRIPDRDAGSWQDTHPLAQIVWTQDKNESCEQHYVNVVKAIKWWRLEQLAQLPDRPKGYPLEHLVGECCPDGVESVAEGVVRSLEEFTRRYEQNALTETTPTLADRGTDQDVMVRIAGTDFADFHKQIKSAASIARQAFDARDPQTAAPLWQQLFGSKFPAAPDDDPSRSGGFSPHSGGAGEVGRVRFAL